MLILTKFKSMHGFGLFQIGCQQAGKLERAEPTQGQEDRADQRVFDDAITGARLQVGQNGLLAVEELLAAFGLGFVVRHQLGCGSQAACDNLERLGHVEL